MASCRKCGRAYDLLALPRKGIRIADAFGLCEKCALKLQRLRTGGGVWRKLIRRVRPNKPCKQPYLESCWFCYCSQERDMDIDTMTCILHGERYIHDQRGQHTGGDESFCLGCTDYIT
jgi:hypothetical protein